MKLDELTDKATYEKTIRAHFSELVKAYENRPEPKPGFFYKKSGFDRLRQEGKLSGDFFVQESYRIIEKTSQEPKIIRDLVETVTRRAVAELIHKKFESEKVKIEK